MKKIPSVPLAGLAATLLAGCMVAPPPVRVSQPGYQPGYQPAYQPGYQAGYQEQAQEPVYSIYDEPPLYQPPPVRVEWAPPPMLVEQIPPQPYPDAAWTGGYWVWQGNWVWAHGRWAPPPRPRYHWVNPYYENRGGSVIFVNGFWAAPDVAFVRPAMNIEIAFGRVNPGVMRGPRPSGPEGIFVPPPPGSRHGLIVPAPLGTAPAVVISAPPVVREGMRIGGNVTNVNNVSRVTIIAPPTATANGQAVNASVPAQAHLAGALPPVVRANAPEPSGPRPNYGNQPGRPQQQGQPPQQQGQLPQQNAVRPSEPPGFNRPPAAVAPTPTAQPQARPPANAMPPGQDRTRPQDRRDEAVRPERPARQDRPEQTPGRPPGGDPAAAAREHAQAAQAAQARHQSDPAAAARPDAQREHERPKAAPKDPKERDADERKRHEKE